MGKIWNSDLATLSLSDIQMITSLKQLRHGALISEWNLGWRKEYEVISIIYMLLQASKREQTKKEKLF